MPLHRGQCFGFLASDKPLDRHQPIAGHHKAIDGDPPLFVVRALGLESLACRMKQLPYKWVDRIGRLRCR